MARPRMSTMAMRALRAGWLEQARDEQLYGTKRSMKAADVLAIIDELLEARARKNAADLLAPPANDRDAFARLLGACASVPTDEACCALHTLRRLGYRVSTEIDDGGLVIVAKKPEEERT